MERVLVFKYPFEFIGKARQLEEILKNHNIGFILYESSGYYNHEFVVRKSGRRWNDIYSIINSVKSAKYSFKNTYIESIDGKLTEIVY